MRYYTICILIGSVSKNMVGLILRHSYFKSNDHRKGEHPSFALATLPLFEQMVQNNYQIVKITHLFNFVEK